MFISNAKRQCLLWRQKTAGDEGFVAWDYHVVLLVDDDGWWVWDLDTTLPLPCRAQNWLEDTFPLGSRLPPEFEPVFRLIDGDRFGATFASDRSHMRDKQGRWVHSPPLWPSPAAPGQVMNLMRFVDMENDWEGNVYRLAEMQSALGRRHNDDVRI